VKSVLEFRTYVRTFFDVDEIELPDSLCDTWLREADNKIKNARKSWPSREIEVSLAVVGATHTYPIPVALANVLSIDGDDGMLEPTSWERAVNRYEVFGTAEINNGRPAAYTLFDGNIRIWPTPDGDYTLNVRGYAAHTDWVSDGDGGIPDWPDEFEHVITSWIMYCAYMWQDDPDMASIQIERFRESMNELIGGVGAAEPTMLIIGGKRRGGVTIPARLRYPWE
jgi:hypothetical protein